VKKVTWIACSAKEAKDSHLGIEEGYIKKQFLPTNCIIELYEQF